MPTIIDSLIVKLGLDSKDLDSKAPASGKRLKDLEAQSAKTEKGVRKLSTASKEASSGFSEVTRAAGGFLALIGGTMAIKAFVSDFIEANAQLNRLSQNLGLGVSTISAWSQATEQVGGSTAGLQGTFDMLSKAQTELKLTGQSSLIPYMSALGVSLADVNGKARPVDDLLLSLADRFSHMDRTTANNMGRMMGIDQGTMNLLLMGRHELELTIKRQRESTAVTKAQAEEASKLQTQIVATKQKFTALGNALMMQAAPAIEKILNLFLRLGNWVLANSEVVGDFLKVLAVGLGAVALAAVPIDLVVVAIAALAAGIALLWQDYQTWKRGGDSLIDWGKWEPGIDAATKGIHGLYEVLKNTIPLLREFMQWGRGKLGMGAATGQGTTLTADYMMSYFQKRGVSKDHAAGIVASLMGESSGKTNASGDGGTAFGLGQWHKGRQAAFKAWAGHDIQHSTGDEQLSFVLHELSGTESVAGAKLNAAHGAYASGDAVSRYYERPRDVEGDAAARGAYAQSLYGIPGASSTVGDAAGASTTSSSKSVSIGTVEVHTQATDAPGIAQSIGDALGNFLFTSQANSGLAY